METTACCCDGIPAHDHYLGFHQIDGVWRALYDPDDIGHLWVDWKAVARALILEREEP